MRTLDRERAALVVVDVQEAFRPAVQDFDDVVANTRRLMDGARILGIPTVVTEQYPKGRKLVAPRYHGRHILNRHPDGLEKCIGCELCAGVCPADAINVVGAENTREQRYSPGERYAQIYQINYLRCIFCGLCVEACPTEALLMTTEYELSGSSRDELIYTKDQLIVDEPIVRHWKTKKELPPDRNIAEEMERGAE